MIWTHQTLIIRVIQSIRTKTEVRNKYGREERCFQGFGGISEI